MAPPLLPYLLALLFAVLAGVLWRRVRPVRTPAVVHTRTRGMAEALLKHSSLSANYIPALFARLPPASSAADAAGRERLRAFLAAQVLSLDGPEQRRVHAALQTLFSKERVAAMEGLVRGTVEEVLAEVAAAADGTGPGASSSSSAAAAPVPASSSPSSSSPSSSSLPAPAPSSSSAPTVATASTDPEPSSVSRADADDDESKHRRMLPTTPAGVAEAEKTKPFDLMGRMAMEVPLRVITRLLGFPLEDRHRFKEWCDTVEFLFGASNPSHRDVTAAVAAMDAFIAYVIPFVERARKQQKGADASSSSASLSSPPSSSSASSSSSSSTFSPTSSSPRSSSRGTLLTALVSDPDLSSDALLLPNLFFLLSAGHVTTASLIANSVALLLSCDRNEEEGQGEPAEGLGVRKRKEAGGEGNSEEKEEDGSMEGGAGAILARGRESYRKRMVQREGPRIDQLREMLTDPATSEAALAELARLTTPVKTLYRQVVSDRPFTVHGVTYRPGQLVQFHLPAINNVSSSVLRRPEDIRATSAAAAAEGTRRGHLSFGAGAHVCVGRWLGGLEARVCLTALFSRFPRIRLACPPNALRFHDLESLHMLEELPVWLE